MDALRFYELTRTLGAHATQLGLRPASYVLGGAEPRHLRRTPGTTPGEVLVYVPKVDRTDDDIIGDMLDGLLAANERPLDDPVRDELLRSLVT